jgi:hypothetical protein
MYPQYPDPAKQRREDMILALIVIDILLVMVLGWLVYSKVINKADSDSKKSSSSSQSSSDSSDDFDHNEASSNQKNIPYTQEDVDAAQNQIASRNVQRKNDASRALSAAQEYISNNTGTLPVSFDDGNLHGTDPNDYPSSISFQYYTGMEVHYGTQESVEADTIILVTGAVCAGDGSTTDTSASSRSIAVMYGQETSTGTFKGVCVTD